jgi:hypothetical protein
MWFVLTLFRWSWIRSTKILPFDEHKASLLRVSAQIPKAAELKDFWRFYKDQSKGKLSVRPTAATFQARFKELSAGLKRYTGSAVDAEDFTEIFYVG